MNELDQTQIEQLTKIGEYLYQEREERAIALEEVAVKTFIPLRLLQALERGQTERLPEPVFVQGFIRRYADALGLDGRSLAKTFVIDLSPVPAKPLEPEVSSAAVPAQAVEQIAVSQPESSLPSRSSSSPPLALIALLGGGAALLLIIGLVGVLKPSEADRNDPATSTTNQSLQPIPDRASPKPNSDQPGAKPKAASSPKSQAVEAVKPSPKPEASEAAITATAPPVTSDAPVKVVVELTDSSWMEIVVDGKSQYEGMLKKGYKKTWYAKNDLILRSGNAGGVRAAYNQGEAKPLGARGEVREVTYSAKPSAAQPN